jgi:Acyl-CoA dehydrogenase, C-terminal domain
MTRRAGSREPKPPHLLSVELSQGSAQRREPGLLYRFTSGMIYAVSFSNVSLGIARGALDAFLVLARDKAPRGARGTLRENNVVQSQVAQCEARLRSSRAFIHETLEEMWETAERKGQFDYDQHVRLRLSTTWAIHQARDVVAIVYGAAGSATVFRREPVRAPIARHACRDPAGSGPAHSFRDRRPGHARPAAAGPRVPVVRGTRGVGHGRRRSVAAGVALRPSLRSIPG